VHEAAQNRACDLSLGFVVGLRNDSLENLPISLHILGNEANAVSSPTVIIIHDVQPGLLQLRVCLGSFFSRGSKWRNCFCGRTITKMRGAPALASPM
jgi:hypothetical protein